MAPDSSTRQGTEVRGLFLAQPVAQSTCRKFHVVVRKDSVLGNVSLKATALDQADGEQSLRIDDISVLALAVGHVIAVPVEEFAAAEGAFRLRNNCHDGAAEGSHCCIPKQDGTRHGEGNFEFA